MPSFHYKAQINHDSVIKCQEYVITSFAQIVSCKNKPPHPTMSMDTHDIITSAIRAPIFIKHFNCLLFGFNSLCNIFPIL